MISLVGRADRCQLVFSSNEISQFHACLIRTPMGLWIIDFASREGVYVNEMRVPLGLARGRRSGADGPAEGRTAL